MGISTQVTFPVSRLVGGSVYEPQTKDIDNKPLEQNRYWFAVAIPKGAETHWNQTEWGAKLYAVAQAGYPQHLTSPTFAWKILDGDSQIPNSKGKIICTMEGYAGAWVINFGSLFAPQICDAEGKQWLLDTNLIERGYYIQVVADVSDNRDKGGQAAKSPGIYLNPRVVAFTAYGPRISSVEPIDLAALSLGGALPPGASKTPIGGSFTPPPLASAAPPTSVPPMMPPVVPHHAILTPPIAAPVAPVRQMTAAAQGTYEQYKAMNWSDAQLIQNGLMLP